MNVRDIQAALNGHGFPCAADGVEGPQTKMQVSRFQLAFCGPGGWLEVDGIAGPQTQTALDWTVQNNALVSFFSIEEVACPHCHCAYVNRSTLSEMFKLRQGVNRPVKVASVYRCAQHNTDIRGASHSQHVLGLAFDPENVTVQDLMTHTSVTGIGSPDADKSTGRLKVAAAHARGTHADLRPGPRLTFFDASNA